MALELISAIIAGVAAAGVVMLLRRTLGDRIPRPTTPIVAGIAMIAMGIFLEYSWFERQRQALEETGLTVITATSEPTALRPWTYAAPFIDRFVVADVAGVLTHDSAPDLRLVTLAFIRRFYPTENQRVLVDCVGERLGDLSAGAVLEDDGSVSDVAWSALEADDPFHGLIGAVCQPPTAS